MSARTDFIRAIVEEGITAARRYFGTAIEKNIPKREIESAKLKFKNNTIYNLEEGDPELEFMEASKGSIRKLVGKHPHTGQEYFYFPYHFEIFLQRFLQTLHLSH